MAETVGIMTFLHNDNYGSALQSYALQRAVTSLGYSAEHIDYDPDRLEKLRNLLDSGNSPRLVLEGLRKKKVRRAQAEGQEKAASFAPFYQAEMKFSPRAGNHRDLKRIAQKYDILLCGSDQIWSPTWLNPAYFLDFARPGQHRASYAPSLGVKQLPSARKQKRMQRLLSGFPALTVREEEGAALLRTLCPGKQVTVAPDPVCLLTREEWLEKAELPGRKHAYLLCYFLGDTEEYWVRVRQLHEKTGLRVKVIPTTESSYRQGYELTGGLSPRAFLGWIAEAAVVCTDSFHATAFCTIFQRDVEVFRRDRESDPASRNSRIDNLLRQLDLDRHMDEIPWECVAPRLAAMRDEGMRCLADALKTAKE